MGRVGAEVRAVRDLFPAFDHEPVSEGMGGYESANDIREKIRRWVADVDLNDEDVVVLCFAGPKELEPLFGGIDDVPVDNGPKAHDAAPHLTSEEVGQAVAAALAG
ncbi:hypothetical protein ADL05_03930 [Nocardiopsis sp. NRRL B-16309]|nr:hypothetical protein ADL05_03930 [Nocardiopsis sp. NRRL B-16309]